MATDILIEQLEGESWEQLTSPFMEFCIAQKQVSSGGCHEGDNNPTVVDGKTFASVAFPDHAADLISHLAEWAATEGREQRRPNSEAEQAAADQLRAQSE